MGKANRRETNRAYYRNAKTRQEAALLRFDVGDLAKLDQACQVAGLSRSAFAKLYLLPMTDAIAARLADIEASRLACGISLATFIERAISIALTAELMAPEAPLASAEFDALFGSVDGGG